jgi:DNA-binding XRE family transcriptional regulator
MSVRKRNMTDQEFWEWFESKLVTTDSGCKEWSACRFAQGYGVVRMQGKNLKAHRLSLEHALGRPLKEEILALHSCHNPPCCNLEHLREGTLQDNMDDKVRANRQSRGETNGKAKLTLDQVNEIRQNINNLTQTELATTYGVQRPCIAKIQRGKTWNLHVDV